MNDFFDSLKEIKKELKKQEIAKKPIKPKKSNSDTNEFKEIFQDEEFDLEKESIFSRQKRLKDEFQEYVKNCNIKKI